VDTAGLTTRTERALDRFRRAVLAIGGKLTLTSAYRPSAYQDHLQNVWDKWAELKHVSDAGCQTLRAEVQAEFIRHHLLETQRPVPVSDHTKGIAFDACVILPKFAHHLRRRVNLDSLARIAGLRRPDIRKDPVHFRLS
jgi:hypothetical protein